jgi:hypothetical protein
VSSHRFCSVTFDDVIVGGVEWSLAGVTSSHAMCVSEVTSCWCVMWTKKKRIKPTCDSYTFCCFMFYTKQVKLPPVHAMEAYRGSRDIAPLVINLGTKWRWVVNFKLRSFYPLERSPVSTEQEAWLATEPVWTFCRKYNILHVPGFERRIV